MSISIEKAVIAKLSKGGQRFEMLVDPVKALEVKAGKAVPLEDLLATEEIFEDAHKGLRASPANINKSFGTSDITIITNAIIREGEVQLTTEQRRQMVEERTKAIAALISRQGVDPRTGAPHPADRVLRAMEQARVRVELERRAEDQIETVLKAITRIIPIRFEKAVLEIKITPQYASRAAGIVRSFGSISRESWATDGSYLATLELPAGMQSELYNKLNTLTHGEAQIKIIKKEG